MQLGRLVARINELGAINMKKKFGNKWTSTGVTIGQGGQAQILEVINVQDGQKYALKLLTNIRRKDRLDLEISVSKSAFRQGCKVIEIVDDYITSEPEARKSWYVMPISNPLSKKIFEEKYYQGNFKLVLTDFNKIAKAVLELHAKEITHRDLKPENLFYEANNILLGDLGLCLPLYEMEEKDRLSGELERIGSIHYTPIEAFHKNPIDGKQKAYDLYALGKILYLMISGKILPGFNNPLDSEFNLVSVYNIPAIHNINLLLKKLLSNDPSQRIEVAEILIERIEEIIKDAEIKNDSSGLKKFQIELMEASAKMAEKIVANNPIPVIEAKSSNSQVDEIKSEVLRKIKENEYYEELVKHFKEYHTDQIDFILNENDNSMKGLLTGPYVKSHKALEPLEDLGKPKRSEKEVGFSIKFTNKLNSKIPDLTFTGTIEEKEGKIYLSGGTIEKDKTTLFIDLIEKNVFFFEITQGDTMNSAISGITSSLKKYCELVIKTIKTK